MKHVPVAHATALPLVCIVLSLVLMLGCSAGKPTEAAAQPAAAAVPTLEVVRVAEQPLDVTLEMPGELAAYQQVALYSKVSGFVKALHVDRGSRVRAGDLVALLEAPELAAHRAEAESRVQSALAQLSAARAKADADSTTYERLRAAASTPGVVAGNDVVIAQKAVEAANGQVSAAEQNVAAARQTLRSTSDLEAYLRITAPFAGVITERGVDVGALVGPNSGPAVATPLVRLVNDARLRLVVPVPEAYTSGTTEGTAIPFSVAAYPGQMFTAQVARLSHAIDPRTRTMAVELDVMNTDRRLAPGTFCQVKWPVRRPGASLLVPSRSIASTTDRTFVVRVRNGRSEWIDVKTGVTSGTLVEVFGNLHAGDEIATRGTDEIRPGTEVRVKAAKAAT